MRVVADRTNGSADDATPPDHLDARAEMTPDPEVIHDLREVDLEQEDLVRPAPVLRCRWARRRRSVQVPVHVDRGRRLLFGRGRA